MQEKVLSLVQCWADAFRNQPELNGVVQVYMDLKQKGIEFPMTDLDTMAPIHTPQRVSYIHSLFIFCFNFNKGKITSILDWSISSAGNFLKIK